MSAPYLGVCRDCGKRIYTTRKAAREAHKTAHPAAHLRPYRCPSGNGWHYGHLTRLNITRGLKPPSNS